MSWVVVGRVGKPHGVRGALKLHLENPDSQTLRPGLKIRVAGRELTVTKVMGGDRVVVEELGDRDEAESLKGKPLEVQRADLPQLDDEEFYLVDLIGLPVFDTGGAALGELVSFSDNTAQPIAHVKTSAGEVQVPFVPPIVAALEEDRVVLDPPGGLFDDDEAT